MYSKFSLFLILSLTALLIGAGGAIDLGMLPKAPSRLNCPPQGCSNNQVPKWNGSIWICAADDNTTNSWTLTGNTGTNPTSNYLGTRDNQALELRVNGQRALRIEPNGTSPNLVGGYSGNTITAGVYGATIVGGGQNGYTNRVTSNFGTIGGGVSNQAGYYATVGGGDSNTASGESSMVGGGYYNTASGYSAAVCGGTTNRASSQYATVGGGVLNTASDNEATVSGGFGNTASGWLATVGGGDNNTASGYLATVPGGANNVASGADSFSAGSQANATHTGSFVWSSNEPTYSWANNTFTIRAHGGARIYTASGTSTGIQLPAGGGSWNSLSDRNAKFNISPIDVQQILTQVAALPVSTWSYKSQEAPIRHMGPMAQDFFAAFGLGEDERYIGSLDADGVALAAIQGLYQLDQEQEKRIQELEDKLEQLGTSGMKDAQKGIPAYWLALTGFLAILVTVQAGMFFTLFRKRRGRP